jgi:hypothetical protein
VTLTNVWLETLADGLVRADLIVGVHSHRTPSLAGKPSRWLLDVVLPGATGSGQQESWAVGPVHRTVIQSTEHPHHAPQHLVRLLAQLDATNAAGIITTTVTTDAASPAQDSPLPATSDGVAGRHAPSTPTVRFRFTPFRAVEPGRHYDPEYL